MQNNNPALRISLRIISILVGVLFIFSGLIKANDPSGLAYKMGEFFEVWAREGYMPGLMMRLNDFSLLFSVIMIAFEIVAGVALIIGYRFRLFAFLILLLTIFFTFLTGYALFSGNIKECGCFGDCIRLQANESFMKDLILLALLLILVFFRSYLTDIFKPKTGLALMVLSLALSLGFQWYTLRYLPVKDCLAYRVGNNILNEMTPGDDYQAAEYRTLLVYEKDGVKKEFTDKNFPWQDTTWKFVDSKSEVVKEAQNAPAILDFAINNYDGQDLTQTVLNYKGNVLLLFIKDVNSANTAD
ncbi:MAG: BT_3928 family protein, partial [Chitinophagaceae bacterium]